MKQLLKACLVACFLGISSLGFAQVDELDDYMKENVDFYMGKKGKGKHSKLKTRSYLGTSEGAHFFRESRNTFLFGVSTYITKVNTNMNMSKTKEIKFPKSSSTSHFIMDSKQFGDSIVLFVVESNKGVKKTELKAYYLDPKSFKLNEIAVLAEVAVSINQYGLTSGFWIVKQSSDYFKIISKPDGSGFAVFSNFKDKKKEETDLFGINVFNNQFEKKWGTEAELPYKERKFQIMDFSVDNDDNAYLAGKLFDKGWREIKNDEVNYDTRIFRFQKGSQTPSNEYSIKLDDLAFPDLLIRPTGDKVTVLALTADIKGFSVNGFYSGHINPNTGELSNEQVTLFDDDFLVEGLSERQQKRAKKRLDKGKSAKSLRNISLDKVIVNDQGELIVIGEQNYITVVQNNNANGTGGTTDYYYHSFNILVFKVSSNNELLWKSKVTKAQRTKNDSGYRISHAVVIAEADNKLLFFYNEGNKAHTEKVLNKKGANSWYTGKKSSVVTITAVDMLSGEQSKREFLNGKKTKMDFIPLGVKPIAIESAVFPFQMKKKRSYGLLTIKSAAGFE